MKPGTVRRAGLVAVLLLVAALAAPVLLAVALEHGALRLPLIHVLSWHMGRTLDVQGPLRLHLLTRRPAIEVEAVTLGNPPWTRPGIMGTAKHVALQFRWGRGLDGLQLDGADLDLQRDADGFANWQFKRPEPGQLPLLAPFQSLWGSNVHLRLRDAQRHVEFDGSVSGGSQGGAPLSLQAQGTLNTRPARLALSGAPLPTAAQGGAYPFEFTATGSGSRVSLKGSLPKPFEMDLFDASFEASGENLKDLYLLLGLRFVNTGKFRLAGRIERRGTLTRFNELALVSGESDLTGNLSVETRGRRPKMTGALHSRVLRSTDIGAQIAGRDPQPDPPVFSPARLSLAGLRHVDAQLRWSAERLTVGRFELSGVATRLELQEGAVDLPAFDARLFGGTFSARAHMDATRDTPPVDVRFELAQGDLQALPLRVDSPPLTGPLSVTAHLTGRGLSVHDVVASAAGNVEFHVQRGTIRASIAELAGLDLRGIGLTLARSQRETGLRCAVGTFQAAGGTLSVERLLIDTDTVQINGQGSIRLGEETLDLKLQGEPKETRLLRVTSPLLIQGTLRRPSISAQAQGASLKLVDRGRAEDADCSALQATTHPGR